MEVDPNSSLLEKIVLDCKDSAYGVENIPIPQNGLYSYWETDVNYIIGFLMLQTSPCTTFVLEDQGFKLNCVITDFAKNLVHWIKAHANVVVIEFGHIAVERFRFENRKDEFFINLIIKADHVKPMKKETIMSTIVLPNWKRLFNVQHVTTPFFASGIKPFCFVLVTFAAEEKETEDTNTEEMWLLLEGDQVSWEKLLVPNREYLMVLPSFIGKNYFSKNVKQLGDLVNKDNTFLNEIMHHADLFPTLDAVAIPENTSLYLQSNSCLSSSASPRNALLWQSLSQGESSNEQILTVYGKIQSVGYELPSQVEGCSLCINKTDGHSNKAKGNASSYAQNWTDPWTRPLVLRETDCDDIFGLQLPLLNIPTPFTSPCSNPENLVQTVVLEDLGSGDVANLYINNWLNYMRPMALKPGMIFLAKFVNRRFSDKGNQFYTTCALSSFEILQNKSSGM